MATKLKTTIKREIRVYGIDTDIIVTLKDIGIEMHVPGFQGHLFGSWARVAAALATPSNAVSYLEGKPIDYLKYQAAKRQKKTEAK